MATSTPTCMNIVEQKFGNVNIRNPAINRRVVYPEASRAKAQRLLRDERVIVSGPVQKGKTIFIPSPCWRPEAVAEWKRRGGIPKKLDRLFDVWIVSASRITLDEARAIYFQYFHTEVAVSKNNLRLAEAMGCPN